MKRVLNNGSVKLLSVLGTEDGIFERAERTIQLCKGVGYKPTEAEMMDVIMNRFSGLTTLMSFKLELKLPTNTLRTFYRSQFGSIREITAADSLDVYLPPSFYKAGPSGFNSMEGKDSNELTTKYDHFYTAAVNFYKKLKERGVCEEQAQLVLPAGMFVTISWFIDGQELIKFIETNYHKSPEVYGYCSALVLYLEENMPRITKWLKQNKWNEFLTI